MQRVSGKAIPGTEVTETFPEALEDLWLLYSALAVLPGNGMSERVSEEALGAYCANRRLRLERWELNVIRALDYRAAINK